jgi:hypothetical protein
VALVAVLLGGGVGAATVSAVTDVPGELAHIVGVRIVDGTGELFDRRDGSRFIVRGANYVFRQTDEGRSVHLFRVGGYDPERVRQDFAALAERGYNSVRVFLDHCDTPGGRGCIGRVGGTGLDRGVLANIDYRRLALLEGRTADGDWLVVRPRRPATRVREVRITTLSSPSWVSWHEIRAWEGPRAAPGSAEAAADGTLDSPR